MKKTIIIFSLITGLFAQRGFTLIGGLSLGNTMYNDNDLELNVTSYLQIGKNVGVEKTLRQFIVGGAYTQLGAQREFSINDEK